MIEPKTQCTHCGASILQRTAQKTGGICMSCKRYGVDPNMPLEVSCLVDSLVGSEVIFLVAARDFLQALENTSHVGGSDHPNKLELDAQKALLRHAIRHNVGFRFHDDHWKRTSYVLIDLFDQDKAVMEIGGQRFRFSDLTKENWRAGTDPMGLRFGYLYRDSAGAVVYKRQTGRS